MYKIEKGVKYKPNKYFYQKLNDTLSVMKDKDSVLIPFSETNGNNISFNLQIRNIVKLFVWKHEIQDFTFKVKEVRGKGIRVWKLKKEHV